MKLQQVEKLMVGGPRALAVSVVPVLTITSGDCRIVAVNLVVSTVLMVCV